MIGNKLKALREKMGLSQKAFAEKYEINSNTLASYELEKREPNIEMLIKFSKIYGVSVDYLIGNDMPRLNDYEIAISKYGPFRETLNATIIQILEHGITLEKSSEIIDLILKFHSILYHLFIALDTPVDIAKKVMINESLELLKELSLDDSPAKKSENPSTMLYLLSFMSIHIDKAIIAKNELTASFDELLRTYTTNLLSLRYRLAEIKKEAEQDNKGEDI